MRRIPLLACVLVLLAAPACASDKAAVDPNAPAAAKSEATPRSVTSVMPEVGWEETPTIPTMRAATVTNSTPKKISPSRWPSTAALMRSTISAEDTSALPGRWPQRFACTWSSRWQPAAPTAR